MSLGDREVVIGNGKDVFVAFTAETSPASARQTLRGGYLLADNSLTTHLLSGRTSADRILNNVSRAAMAMNAKGTVLGVFASDIFRVNPALEVRSLEAITAHGQAIAPLFPLPGETTSRPVVLTADHGADAAGSFLFASCDETECTVQLLDDTGAPALAEIPVFTFNASESVPTSLAATYVEGTGYLVVAGRGEEVHRAIVTAADGPTAMPSLMLPPELCGPALPGAVTSIRVGSVFDGTDVLLRVTANCGTDLFVRNDETGWSSGLCGTNSTPDACQIHSARGHFLLAHDAIVRTYSVAEGVTGSWPAPAAPVRVAAREDNSVIAAANAEALFQLGFTPMGPTAFSEAVPQWRQRLAHILPVQHLTHSTPALRRTLLREHGPSTRNFLFGGSGAPVELTYWANSVLGLDATRSLVHDGYQLRLVDPASEEPAPVSTHDSGEIFLLGGAPAAPLMLASYYGYTGDLLYGFTLDPSLIGSGVTPGVLPGTPEAFVSAEYLGAYGYDFSGFKLASNATRHLWVGRSNYALGYQLLDADGAALMPPSRWGDGIYTPSQPNAIALANGDFFVTWSQARTRAVNTDLFGAVVRAGAQGAELSPTLELSATSFGEVDGLVLELDDDHLAVAWTEHRDEPRRASRVLIRAFSRSSGRARAIAVVEEAIGDHAVFGLDRDADNAVIVRYSSAADAPMLVRSRRVQFGGAVGAACDDNDACITDYCEAGRCAEPVEPVVDPCDLPCAEVRTDGCGPRPKGTAPNDGQCEGYVCDGEQLGCPSGCTSDRECAENASCEEGSCVVTRACSGEAAVVERGVTRSCGGLRCDPERAECFARCESQSQCATGFVCDERGACVSPPEPDSGGCQSSRDTSAWWPALLALVLLAWKRNRAHERGALAAGLLFVLPGAARAQQAEAPQLLPADEAVGFTPMESHSMSSAIALPGTNFAAWWIASSSYANQAVRLRATLNQTGVTGWAPARGFLTKSGQCPDGSLVLVETADIRGQSRTWLHHVVSEGGAPAQVEHSFEIPTSYANNLNTSCSPTGVWVPLGEAKIAFQHYTWNGEAGPRVDTETAQAWLLTRGERTARVELSYLEGVPQLRWITANGVSTQRAFDQVRGVVHVGANTYISTVHEGLALLLRLQLGADGTISATESLGQPAFSWPAVNEVTWSNDTAYFTQGSNLFRLAPSADGSAPIAVAAPAFEVGSSGSAVLRGPLLERITNQGRIERYDASTLAQLESLAPPTTAPSRSLYFASADQDGTVRRLGRQRNVWFVSTDDTLTPLTGMVNVPTAFGAIGGEPYLVTRNNVAAGGYHIEADGTLTPFPALDGITRWVTVGDTLASVHYTQSVNNLSMLLRFGERTRTLRSQAARGLEYGLRNQAALARDREGAIAVFASSSAQQDQSLYWARLEANGIGEAQPLSQQPGVLQAPAIACDPSGIRGCLVVWQRTLPNLHSSVHYARILADGSTPDGDGKPLAESEHDALDPNVAWADDGDHFLVVWQHRAHLEQRTADSNPSEIRGALVRADGTAREPVRLTDEPIDEQRPQLLAGSAGRLKLAYEVFRPELGSMQLALRELRTGALPGSECSDDTSCASGVCLDGICCEASCRSGCGVCNVAGALGQCVPRAEGSTSVDERCGDLLCDGESLTCPAGCRDDGDCSNGTVCDPQTAACVAPGELSSSGAPPNGGELGTTRCETNFDCPGSAVCSLSGFCEPAPAADDGGCHASPSHEGTARHASAWLPMLMVVAVGLGLRRRQKP